ncbi:MAG TPA: response regulator transcription factor [Nocardioides sp.]|jgi:DNA-binding NarL/FixJ family response regulator|nr:response regulator transcription factor [uncultured Nocardioides sp.]HEX5985215.1 response regulator transcription factor [Nocardioides sp.]
MSDTIRVVLVDDHAVVRTGLAQLLSVADDIEVVGTAGDGAEAIRVVHDKAPDVVLMDLQMPGTDGVEATRALQGSGLPTQVLVLTSFSDGDRIVAALDAGAVGYLLKDAEPDEVLAGIRAVSRGESPLHPRAARALLSARRPQSAAGDDGAGTVDDPVGVLTDREVEVLSLVRGGLANKQIARRLGITERTVKAHLSSIFQRLDVTDRTQAALWAERHGL